LRVGLVRTCWNETLVNSLADQTKDMLIESGVAPSNILESLVPGSFELPWAAAQLIDAGQIDVVVCFGVLVKGETMHFEYISGSVAQGLMQLQLQKSSYHFMFMRIRREQLNLILSHLDVPVLDAVLNCLTIEQADARCNSKSQLPLSLAATAIHMGALRRGLLPLYQPVGGEPVSIAAPIIKPSLQFVQAADTQVVLTPQPCGN
jgi:6,7-dimethyl-8-ribityllumazine synthase